MKNKWYRNLNILYVPDLKNKWYRHFNILAALFIGIGGIGMNVYHTLPTAFYIASLALGVIIYAVFLILMQRDKREAKSD